MANIKTPTNAAALTPKNTQAAAKKAGTVLDYLKDERFKSQVAAALPKAFDTDSFLMTAMNEFRYNPQLAQCSVPSVLGFFLQSAACGLRPSTTLGLCYPVPFRNKNTGQMECQFLLSYRGMMEIARRSGKIAKIETNIVHENDEMELEYGFEPKFKFVPLRNGDPGAMVGAYVQVDFTEPNTKPMVMYMTKEEIDKHRRRSRASNSGPWVTDYEAMAKKTLVRAIFKMLPASIEQVVAETGDGGVAKYNASAVNDDDLVEISFADASEAAEETPSQGNVEDAVENMAEEMKA